MVDDARPDAPTSGTSAAAAPTTTPAAPPAASPASSVPSGAADGRVRVACCQVALAVGDLAGNRARTAAAIGAAVAAGARVVVVPELSSSGYVVSGPEEARALAEPADGPTVSGWVELARRHDLVVVGGFCELDPDGVVRNSAVLVDASGVRALYRKAHLWDAEGASFVPGDEAPPVVETAHGRIGVMVCYDLELPEWTRTAALAGAQLLCAPVNWPLLPRPDGERPGEVVRAQAAASGNRMAIAVADRTGLERGVDWVGGSVVLDADGWPLTALHLGEEALVVADVDLAASLDKRISTHNDVHRDRRPELYGAVTRTTATAP